MAVTLLELVRRLWRNGVDGGTPITAEKLNDIEDLLASLHAVVSSHDDQLGNLQSGGTTGVLATSGGPENRGVPGLRRLHWNEISKVLEVGWPDGWRTAAGAAITAGGGGTGGGGTGTTNAPQNPFARTNPDGSIDTGADPLSGTGWTYNLYELRQSTPLATGLTTPASHRTPNGTGTYGYWWTGVNGGVETAPSAIAYCARPYGASVDPTTGGSSGGGVAGTPADLLNIGGSGGFWSLDVGYPSGNQTIEYDQIDDGWSATPYFVSLTDGSGVQMRVPVDGGTTPNSEYPRVELRERNSDGTKKSFNAAAGIHSYALTLSVPHLPPVKPEMCVFQFHNASDDTMQIRVEGSTWRLSLLGQELDTSLLTGYTGGEVALAVRLYDSGRLSIKINGTEKYNGKPGLGSGQYAKTGAYLQSNRSKGEPAGEYGLMVIKAGTLAVSHS